MRSMTARHHAQISLQLTAKLGMSAVLDDQLRALVP